MKFLRIILIFCAIISQTISDVTELSSVLKSLLKTLDIPVRVSAKICFNSDLKTWKFYKNLVTIDENHPVFLFNVYDLNIPITSLGLEEHKNVIVLDLSCKNVTDVFEKAGQGLYLFYRWIIIDTSIEDDGDKRMMDDKIKNIFEKLPITPSSEIFYFERQNKDKDKEIVYFIKQVYRNRKTTPLIVEHFGTWKNNKLTDLRWNKVTSRRRHSLDGEELPACLVATNKDTLNHLTDYRDKHIDPITKVNYVLTNHLYDFVNATVKYSIVNSWGYVNKMTGKWDGMMGQLMDGTAEVGATPLFLSIERIPIIQYISMPSPTKSRFVFRSPKLSYTDNVFILPFNRFVWFCSASLIILIVILLTIATVAEWKTPFGEIDEADSSGVLRPLIGDIFMMVFGASCQQGSSVLPRSAPARAITFTSFIVLMFLYTSYAAYIVALLQAPSTKIKTLKDLLHSKLKIGQEDAIYFRYYLPQETEPTRKAIYEKRILNKDGTNNFMPVEQGVKKIREGLFAFHMELGVGYKVVSETFFEHEKCDLQEVYYFDLVDPWYAIPKNSTYKEHFKLAMFRMREHGLQDRHNARLYTRRPKCSSSGGIFITVGLVDTSPAMLVLAWGVGISLFILFFEIIIRKYKLGKKINSIIKKIFF